MKRYVFDSWAILAWLQREKSSRKAVERLLARVQSGSAWGGMSWIQVGEVFCQLERRSGVDNARRFTQTLQGMGLRLDTPTKHSVIAAASWKAKSKISYADGFLIELGIRSEAALVTGDPEILEVAAGGVVELEWVGAKV